MKLFARLRRWFGLRIRNLLQRLNDTYYEGPDVPVRLAQAVKVFRAMRPHASADDWALFAAEHAAEAYRSGYTRGVEWQARSPQSGDEAHYITVKEQDARHDFNWVELAPAEQQLAEMLQANPDAIERLSPEQRVIYAERLGLEMNGFTIELFPEEEKK